MAWQEEIAAAARRHDVAAAAPTLGRFVELFARWNQRINLSAARTLDEIARHVVDSLAVVPYLRDADRILDVGSGGGFPGIIAASCFTSKTFRCVEPIHKKTAFLSTATRELGLAKVEVVSRRVDAEVDHDFDVAMSRATFDLSEWLALGETLVRAGGQVLGMEGREQVELGPHDTRHPYDHGDRDRAIIVRRRP